MDVRNEAQLVEEYRKSSEIYINLFKAVALLKAVPWSHQHKLNLLKNAKTFEVMLSVAEDYSIDTLPKWATTGINALTSFSSLFLNSANFAYYAYQLKGDIVNYLAKINAQPVEEIDQGWVMIPN